MESLARVTEALIFAADEPVAGAAIAATFAEVTGSEDADAAAVEEAVEALNRAYAEGGRTFRIQAWAGGFRMATVQEVAPFVRALVAAEAERYVRTVLAPGLSIGTSPPANVLVGLSTWFWMEGWDGAPINVAVAAPWGATVNVELSLSDVRWDFGDGAAPAEGDLGRPYPEESQIQHVYTHRSTSRTSPDGAYSVTASIQIDVRYWYEGMGPFGVAPLVQEHAQPVVVRQLQAVLG